MALTANFSDLSTFISNLWVFNKIIVAIDIKKPKLSVDIHYSNMAPVKKKVG